jgi:hypothetical protein
MWGFGFGRRMDWQWNELSLGLGMAGVLAVIWSVTTSLLLFEGRLTP